MVWYLLACHSLLPFRTDGLMCVGGDYLGIPPHLLDSVYFSYGQSIVVMSHFYPRIQYPGPLTMAFEWSRDSTYTLHMWLSSTIHILNMPTQSPVVAVFQSNILFSFQVCSLDWY